MMDLYNSMVVTDWFILIISISIHHCQLMFIFTLFTFIKYECNLINNLMLFYLQIRYSPCLLDHESTSSSIPGGLLFYWSAGVDPMHDELRTYLVMLWFIFTNIIIVRSMLNIRYLLCIIMRHIWYSLCVLWIMYTHISFQSKRNLN
jgi:hypothetical protein